METETTIRIVGTTRPVEGIPGDVLAGTVVVGQEGAWARLTSLPATEARAALAPYEPLTDTMRALLGEQYPVLLADPPPAPPPPAATVFPPAVSLSAPSVPPTPPTPPAAG